MQATATTPISSSASTATQRKHSSALSLVYPSANATRANVHRKKNDHTIQIRPPCSTSRSITSACMSRVVSSAASTRLAPISMTCSIASTGRCLQHAQFRDVDLRLILPDEEFAQLFPRQPASPSGRANDPYWLLVCRSISEWIKLRTGLPIDFQIQQMTAANEEYSLAEHPRNPMGFITKRERNE